ncbi:MAG: hypothetical protein SVO26_04815 [Chloroflexota bacterium]|nr:hypothetical protein [Chloroflexota bacterium]
MSSRTPFQWYVGAGLAVRLPYRKKGLIFGSKVCEWPAVVPMAAAGFFVGCSLSLADKSAAEEILMEASKPQHWRTTFSDIIQDLEIRKQGVDVAMATFDSIFPEFALNKHNREILTEDECVISIGQRVLLGLMFGVLFPEMALSILEAWVSQEQKWNDLGVGGLRVDASPLLVTVEESCRQAQLMYEGWLSE